MHRFAAMISPFLGAVLLIALVLPAAATAAPIPESPTPTLSPLKSSSPTMSLTTMPTPPSPLPTSPSPLAGTNARAAFCTVVFDVAGGGPRPPGQQVAKGHLATRPASDPTRDGYLFDGWFIENTPVAYDFNQPVTTNTTITAHWSKNSQWTISPDHGPDTGDTTVTLTPPPARGIRFSQISTGGSHSMALGSDGNIYTWGDNSNGQLGRDTGGRADDKPGRVATPAGVLPGFRFTKAAAGDHSSMALGSDGNIYTWGLNNWGQLGRDTGGRADDKPGRVATPAQTPSNFTWTKATTRWDHTLAFGSDGKLYAWGRNQGGQLGNTAVPSGNSNPNAYTIQPVPVTAPEGVTFSEASTGHLHSLAISTDGNLYAWGQNSYGMLGIDGVPTGSVVAIPKAVQAPAGVTFTQISAGSSSCLALDSDGNLYAWGDNSNGQLGLGDKAGRPTPTKVTEPATGSWKEASIRDGYSLATSTDGSLYAWGDNSNGQLGVAGTPSGNANTAPAKVETPSGTPQGFNWVRARTGWLHSLALGSDGNLYTWGGNGSGQLGRDTGTNGTDPHPGRVGFPSRGTPTRVLFDQNQGTGQTAGTDGTWTITTPAHTPGSVPVTIDWTLDGTTQPNDTNNTYRYIPVGSLPLTGGTGILLIIAAGLLLIVATAAARRHRYPTGITPPSEE